MKSFLLAILLAIISISAAFAAAPKSNLPGDTHFEYQIVLKSQELPGGERTLPQVISIERLPKDQYLPNSIYVKTKNIQTISSGMNAFYSSSLMMSMEPLKITGIKAPFEFVARSAKSSDKPRIMATVAKIYEVSYSSGTDPYDICKILMANPEVEYATPIFVNKLYEYTPNDPNFASQSYLTKLEAKKAWEITKGSKSIIVGIIDSGVDIDHEDLKANIFVNTKEIPDNQIDDDKNGFVDDVSGWDFVGNVSNSQAASGTYRPDNNVRPGSTHGTHVAGLAAAIGDNNVGVAGIGFNISILPVKHGTDAANSSGVFRGYEGILYAASMGAQVINCSWGGPGYSPVAQEVINQATALGSVVVVAAGNDGVNLDENPYYPACLNNVITVGATSNSDQWVNFSNYGMKVTIYAPGYNVLSTIPGNQYKGESGTSMSSPIAAGIAALVRVVHPEWTPEQVYWHMRNSTDNTITQTESSKPLFYGRINAYKAVRNNFKDPGNICYGVGLDMDSPDATILNDYEPHLYNLKFKNYLAPIGNLKVTFTPLDKYISLSKDEITITALASAATFETSLQVRLLDNNPWFKGEARILVTYSGENYVNYELLKIPIQVISQNKFYVDAELPDYYQIQWADAISPDINTFFAAGYMATGQGVLYGNKIPGKLFSVSSNAPSIFTIFTKDGNTLYAGVGDKNTSVYKSGNGGQSWTSINTTSITPFINKIWFFNDNEGLILGDPTSTMWGIGTSNDAGATWTPVNNTPSFLSGETGFVGSVAFKDDNAWFGTTKGRIFHSSDKGKSWTASTIFNNGHVTHICFMNADTGVAVYHEGADLVPPQKLAYTINGGKTWTANVASSDIRNLFISSVYHPENSDIILALHTGGEIYSTSNLGRTWSPVLSQKAGAARIGAACSANGKVKMWGIHKLISSLEYKYPMLNAIKTYVVEGGKDEIVFDSCEIGKNKTYKSQVSNTGNQSIGFTLFEFKNNPDDEFNFYLSKPTEVNPGESVNLNLRFAPKNTGLRTGTLVIHSDSDEPEKIVSLSGYGLEAASVKENNIISGITLYPNPSSDRITVSMNLETYQYLTIELYTMTGAMAAKIFEGAAEKGSFSFEANINSLSAGAYYLQINDKVAGKVIINK